MTLCSVVKGDGPSTEPSWALPSQLDLSLCIPKMGQTFAPAREGLRGRPRAETVNVSGVCKCPAT